MNSYKSAFHHHQVDETVVLDLSKRRDSVETAERKTPSPYDASTFSDNSASPSTNNSGSAGSLPAQPLEPLRSPSTGYYYEYRQHQLPYHPAAHHHNSPPPPATYALYPGYAAIPKHEPISPKSDEKVFPRIGEGNAYALQAAAFKQQLFQMAPSVVSKPKKGTGDEVSDSENSESSAPAIQRTAQAAPMLNITTSLPDGYPMVVGRDGKLSRPFKAYPKNPLSLAASFSATDAIVDTQSADKYNLFRKRMLEQIATTNGGQMTISNPKMRRRIPPQNDELELPSRMDSPPHQSKADLKTTNYTSSNNDSDSNTVSGNNNNTIKDSAYYERRKKNNAAAKKSRDRRRIKEDEISIRAAFLERENIELKFELAAVRKQLSLYSGVPTSP
jgi:protein giant